MHAVGFQIICHNALYLFRQSFVLYHAVSGDSKVTVPAANGEKALSERKVAVFGENDEKASTEIGKKRKGVKRDVSADKK